MTVRSIDEAEAGMFARIARAGDDGAWVRRLWESAESCPAWCFIAEEDGAPLARVAYLSFPGAREEIQMLALHLPWEGDHERIGRVLLLHSLLAMRTHGARTVEYQYAESVAHAPQRERCCAMIGLPLLQRKERFLLSLADAAEVTLPGDALQWRSLDAVGNERFVEAIARVSAGSLDTVTAATIARQGAAGFAGEFFAILKALDDRPAWWELAYDAGGELVGLIVPQRFSDTDGAINYIGVVPEQRGKGHVDRLLARGVARLREHGLLTIVADTDSRNMPMAHAFLRAGFELRGGRMVHHAPLAAILDGAR